MVIVEFKDKLRKLRTEAGLSQEALAEIIHISRSAIAKYENGNGKPSEETLKALEFYFYCINIFHNVFSFLHILSI